MRRRWAAQDHERVLVIGQAQPECHLTSLEDLRMASLQSPQPSPESYIADRGL